MRLTTQLGVALCAISLFATPALAVPATMLVEGVLLGSGGAAPDGDYKLTFAIYGAKSGGASIWKEGPVSVKVAGGRFRYALGGTKPIDSAKLASTKTAWLGMTIGSDPELPRSRVHAAPYALVAGRAAKLDCKDCVNSSQIAGGSIKPSDVGFAYAAAAAGIKGGAAAKAKALDCTGCVTVGHLKFDKDVNLGGRALTAGKITVKGDVVAGGIIAAKQFVGDGSKLTGIKTPAGECKTAGFVVKGINPDGSLKCIKAMDPAGLPKDGIDEISNDLLANQFLDTVANSGKRTIIDNSPNPIVDTIDFPDIGVAQDLQVNVHLTNSDISKVTVFLLPPNAAVPKMVISKLYGPTMAAGIMTGWPTKPALPKAYKHYLLHKLSGKGKVLNTIYPSKTKPVAGNLHEWLGKNPKGKWRLIVADNAFKDNKSDGELVKWSITLKTLSNQKVQVKGNLVLGSKTATCDRFAKGAIRYNETLNAIQVCNGKAWLPRLVGTSKTTPARDCKQIKDWAPMAKSGVYWIDPDGAGKGVAPFEIYCDQQTEGGGWTLNVIVAQNSSTMNRKNRNQWYDGKLLGDCKTIKNQNALCQSYNTVKFSDVMIRSVRYADRNLGWRHREHFTNMKTVVRGSARYFTRNRLFGAVINLDYLGNRDYHRDCGVMFYGFHGRDWNQSYSSYMGVMTWTSGHAGGIISAGIFNHNHWKTTSDYGRLGLSTQYCVTDFAVGGGYGSASSGDDAYAINAHFWGSGNSQTHSWAGHAVFVRRSPADK